MKGAGRRYGGDPSEDTVSARFGGFSGRIRYYGAVMEKGKEGCV